MICPRCAGKKIVVGYGCPGFKRIELPCFDCNGTGDISAAQQEAIRKGDQMRKDRLKAGRSSREQAAILGISLKRYVDLEHGRVFEASKSSGEK